MSFPSRFSGPASQSDPRSTQAPTLNNLAERAKTNEELEARMSLQLLRRIQNLAAKMECDPSEILRDALYRFLETEEARLGIPPAPPVSLHPPENRPLNAPRDGATRKSG